MAENQTGDGAARPVTVVDFGTNAPIADPAGLGLAGFAMTTVLLSLVNSGAIEGKAINAVLPLALANDTTASKTVAITVGFTRACITTSRTGLLTVGAGEALCVADGGSLNGTVEIRVGGSLWLTGGSIRGPIRSDGAAAITLCGSTLDAPVRIAGTRGRVLIGGIGCAGNRFGAPVRVTSNSGGVSFVNNRATAPVRITDNSGPFAFSGNTFSASVRVSTNT